MVEPSEHGHGDDLARITTDVPSGWHRNPLAKPLGTLARFQQLDRYYRLPNRQTLVEQ